jgi:uncharacterized protein
MKLMIVKPTNGRFFILNVSTKFIAILVACLKMAIISVNAEAASFDCERARTNVEKMICADEDISAYDIILADLYRESRAKEPQNDRLKEQQFNWIKNRDKCANRICLFNSYSKRIREFKVRQCFVKGDEEEFVYWLKRNGEIEGKKKGTAWSLAVHNDTVLDGKIYHRGHLITTSGNDFLGTSSELAINRTLFYFIRSDLWNCDKYKLDN